jgi:hypothetical protein
MAKITCGSLFRTPIDSFKIVITLGYLYFSSFTALFKTSARTIDAIPAKIRIRYGLRISGRYIRQGCATTLVKDAATMTYAKARP